MKNGAIRIQWAAAALLGLLTAVGTADTPTNAIPIRVTIPPAAARFTVAINDASGARTRNLGGDLVPGECAVGMTESGRVVEVLWDGRDDEGRTVRAGRYTAVGLSHEGLRAKYDLCFYNPGTPPWETGDGAGGWGADSVPARVARAGEWMALCWPDARDGSGIIGIAPDGSKKWGRSVGATFLAGDEAHVYALTGGDGEPRLLRLDATNGLSRPFLPAGRPRTDELALTDIFTNGVPGRVTGMAAREGVIVLTLDDDVLAWVDGESGELLRRTTVPMPYAPAYAPDGTLYAVIREVVHRVVFSDGTSYPLRGINVRSFWDLAVDNAGNLVIAEGEPARMVRIYRPDGLLVRMLGTPGGRPRRGPFAANLFSGVNSLAVDRQGQIWTVEVGDLPRRVSVWTAEGQLVRDYVGNVGGGGVGCYLHETDPFLGYAGPVEFQLDHELRTWRVSQVLWAPNARKGEVFAIDPGAPAACERFVSDASGDSHEYLYSHDGPHVLFMRGKGGWQPVSAVCLVGHMSGSIDRDNIVRALPSGEFAGLQAHDGCFWNDENGDGVPQRAECVIVPAAAPGELDGAENRGVAGLSLSNGGGGRMGRDLSFFADGIVKYGPVGFTPGGAPRYGPEGMKKLPVEAHGDLVPVADENLLIGLGLNGGQPARVLGIDSRDGAVRWSCPNPDPGSPSALPAATPSPDVRTGSLKTMGVALVDDSVGRVFALRGRSGQDFFMTTDGLFVGALFRGGRLPSPSLPASEDQLAGVAMEEFGGGEAAGGWFGRQSDGRIRLTVGMARQACMVLEVNGLETIRRFDPVSIAVGERADGEGKPGGGAGVAAGE